MRQRGQSDQARHLAVSERMNELWLDHALLHVVGIQVHPSRTALEFLAERHQRAAGLSALPLSRPVDPPGFFARVHADVRHGKIK